MKAASICDACGAHVPEGDGVIVEQPLKDLFFHQSCAGGRRPPPRRRTGYEGIHPKETGGPFKHEHLDETPPAD